jgi:hypothetical protein
MTTTPLPTFSPLPDTYLTSEDDLVAGTRESFVAGYDRTKELGNQLLDLNHREARLESELETSDSEAATEYRKSVAMREERIAAMDKAIQEKRTAALAELSSVEAPTLPQEVIGNLYDKARRSVMDYVDAKVFPQIAEALGENFSIPTKAQLIGGKKTGLAEAGYKPRFDRAVFNGKEYDTTSELAKALGVNNVEYVANAILLVNGGRKIAAGEHNWTLRINDVDYKVQVFGNEPKADSAPETTEAPVAEGITESPAA